MTRPISAIGNRCRHGDGFALIEVILALAVLALLAGVALPRAARAPGPVALRTAAFDIAAVLRSDRNTAIRQRREVLTRIDAPLGIVESGATGARVTLPRGVELEFLGATKTYGSRTRGIRFLPNGYSSGGALAIRGGSSAYQLIVNPLTGRISAPSRHSADFSEPWR